MARKYLNEIGIDDNFMDFDPDDKRWGLWNKEIEECGFASYETWGLDIHFYIWLYERLKMFLEVNGSDPCLNNKHEYKGSNYTRTELICQMLHGCELALLEEFKLKCLTEDEWKSIEEVRWIWATIMPYMWW